MATEVSTGRSTNELLVAATQGESAAVEALYTHYLQFGTDVALEHGAEDPLAAYDQAFLQTMARSLELSRAEPGSFASHIERTIRGVTLPDEGETSEPNPATSTEADDETEAKADDETEAQTDADPAPPQTPALDHLDPTIDEGPSVTSVVGNEVPVADELTLADELTVADEVPAVDEVPLAEDSAGADHAGIEPDEADRMTGPVAVPLTADEAVDEALAAEAATAAELGILPLAATASRPRTPNQMLDRFHARSLVTIVAALALAVLIGLVFVQSTTPSEPEPGTDPTGQIDPTTDPNG